MKQPCSGDEVQHGVAQKFEALVIFQHVFGVLVQIRAVCEGALKQREVVELCVEPRLNFIQIGHLVTYHLLNLAARQT